MKIAVLFSNYMYSYLRPFLELCEAHGIEIDFFKFAGDKISFKVRAKNFYVIHSKWKAKKFNTVRNIEKEIKSLVNIDDYDYFLSDTLGLSFKNACNFFHGHTEKYKIEHTSSGLLQRLLKLGHAKQIKEEARYYKNTKLCITGSSEMKRDYIQNACIEPDKIKIIHPGADNIYASNIKRKENDGIFTIGAVTCGFQLKGGYNILRALRLLKKEFPADKIRFKLIHPNYNEQWQLKLYIKFFGLEKYLEFLPFQNNINNFYSSIDCFICASNSEAFSRTVTEAMLQKVPVIAGSNIGAADIIENGINGYIYEYGKDTAKNLASAVKTAYDNRNINQQLILNARNTAEKITWRAFAKELFKTLQQN